MLGEPSLNQTLYRPSYWTFLGHICLSREMIRQGCWFSVGTFNAAPLDFRKCPLLSVPSLEFICRGRGDYLKATGSFPSLLPLHSKTTHPGPTLSSLLPKVNFPTKEAVGTRGGFLSFFTCLLACFHVQIGCIQRTETGETGSGRCGRAS